MFRRTSTQKYDHSHDHSHGHSHGHSPHEDPEKAMGGEASSSPHAHSLPMIPEDPHDYRPDVSVRYHSVAGFLWHWSGSITEQTWPKVLGYAVYLSVVTMTFTIGCSGEAIHSGRCKFGTEDVGDGLEGIFALWMAFTAFLFTSFVNAGLSRFRYQLNLVRSLQGRCNELSLMLNSHARIPKGEHTLSVAMRLLGALPYTMFGASSKLSPHFDEFALQAKTILLKEEWESLQKQRRSDQPYTILLWIHRLVQDACHSPDAADIFFNPSNLSFAFGLAVERTRGTFGSLIDSLDDAILPFPFSNLIIANIYIVFLGLPFAMLASLGYAQIPAGIIYFWFLDGMVTFVFLVDAPFTDKVLGKAIDQALIDLHSVCDEAARAIPRRFPGALSNRPGTISTIFTV